MNDLLLKVHNLQKIFPIKASAFSTKKLALRAVDGVSFDLKRGETLGLVGESGCGKTTVGRCLLRIYDPDSGRVFLDPTAEVVDAVLPMDAEADEIEREIRALASNGMAKNELWRKTKELKRKADEIREKANEIAVKQDILSMHSRLLKSKRQRMQMVFQDPWSSLNPRMIIKDLVAEGPREFGTHTHREVDILVRDLLDKVGLPSVAATRYPHEFSGGQW